MVVPVASFVLAGLAIAVAVGLAATFRFTRFGLATRAAAEQEKGAILTGLSPDRLGFLNWIIASMLAGAAVICIAGTSSKLDPIETSLLIVPALAAALLGRLNGFALTTVGRPRDRHVAERAVDVPGPRRLAPRLPAQRRVARGTAR